MTPEELKRTMGFILRSQADSVVRMDRLAERDDRLQAQIDGLVSATRDLLTISRHALDRLEGEAG
jgi:hypothetical protein